MSLYSKTFGVEMECCVPNHTRGQVAAELNAAGVPCYDANYTHSASTQWKVVSDGSVNGNGAMELVSPILRGEAGFEQVAVVCRVLNRLGAQVNRSCGLHVHVGARELSIKALRRLAIFYAQHEDVIDNLLPVSRRGANAGNGYCCTNKNTNLAALATARDAMGVAVAVNGGGRYAKLNFTAFRRHSTVEFRHHSGTVDGAKVIAWTKACLRMVVAAERDQEEAIMVPTQTAPQGNLRLRRIFDMVARPEGASREEIAAMLGRRTAPPVAKILRAAGIGFTVRRGRYYFNREAIAVPQLRPTLATFTAKLAMPADEVAFWDARVVALANQPMELAA